MKAALESAIAQSDEIITRKLKATAVFVLVRLEQADLLVQQSTRLRAQEPRAKGKQCVR